MEQGQCGELLPADGQKTSECFETSLGQYGVVYYLNTMSDILSNPIFWVVVTAISEIIGMSKLKDNSIIELVLHTLMRFKPKG